MIMTALVTASVLLLIVAALQDIVARTVSNGLVAVLAVAGALLRGLDGSLPAGLLAAAIIFAIAIACWRRGWMGGGDVKLLGAAALLVPPGSTPALVMDVCLSEGVLSLVFLAARRRVAVPGRLRPRGLLARAVRVERWRLRRGGPLPYAVAIASGAIIVIVQ